MSDLTLRLVKGSPLTNQEVDDNFSNLNADKYQSGDSPTFVDITADSIQVTGGDSTNWNTAYGWGDHSTAGYLTSYTETDPIYTASSWYTTTNNSADWDTAYGWGDHSVENYTVDGTDVTFSSVQITGGTGTQGTLAWNAVDGTIDLDLGTATLQIGQEEHFYAKATEAIANGDVVMFAGAQGDHVLIAKADHSVTGFKPEYIMGVATQAFANNQFGYVTTFGKVRGLNTSTLDEGDILYSDPNNAGALITTRPTAPDHVIQVAAVLSSNPSQGVILVRLTHFLDTDEVEEGSTNLYFTDARAVSAIQNDASWNASDWDTAFGWGNHASAGYLTSYTETDPVFTASPASGITSTNITNWDAAYGWGDHSSAGYLTGITGQSIDNLSDVAITTATTDQILKYNGSEWVNADLDAGAITTSTTAPVSPSAGDLWWNSETGQLKIYYADGNSSQWVDAAASASVQEVTLSFPFYDSSTTLDSIALISNQNLPFYKADGTQDNITVTS